MLFRSENGRPSLLSMEAPKEEMVTPNVSPYTVDADLGNVENLWQFYMTEEMAAKAMQTEISPAEAIETYLRELGTVHPDELSWK